MEKIGTIGYGSLDLNFFVTESVEKFLKEKNIPNENCFPKTQFFYQGVLMKLGISHSENKELEIVFNSIRLDGEGVFDVISDQYEKFESFPIHVEDKIYLVDFGVKVK